MADDQDGTPPPPEARESRLHAEASGSAWVAQAGRDLHLHYADRTRDRVRTESGAVVDVCPYPGLAAFDQARARWFFGRTALVAELVDILRDRLDSGGGIQVVVAPSGAGKSSLLRAGLLARLAQGTLPGSARWPALVLTPTATPLRALTSRLVELDGEEPRRSPVVVVVDQFEELFTLCGDPQERQKFVDLLARLAAPGADGTRAAALVVIGLRADFYAACVNHPELRAALRDRPLVVGPMTETELREAIRYPAQEAGLELESGLVELLLRDLGADPGGDQTYAAERLPLLAHALRVCWQERNGATLTVSGYESAGGIQRAVAVTADRVYDGLDDAGKQLARRLFLRLTRIGDGTEDTRRRVARDALITSGDVAVLDAFTRARMLTQRQDTVEITHEALLHGWPRLRRWTEDDRAGRLVHQDLEDAAAIWRRDGDDPSLLYRDSRLAIARTWRDQTGRDELSPLADEFLTASLRQQRIRGRRRRASIAALLALTLVAVVGAGAAVVNAVDADRQRGTAAEQRRLAAARSLLANADALRDSQAGTSLLLGIAAYRVSGNAEARASLVSGMMENHYAGSFRSDDGVGGVVFHPSNPNVVLSTAGPQATLWNVADPTRPRELSHLVGHTEGLNTAAFSWDGDRVVTVSWDTTAILWDVSDLATPTPLATLSGHTSQVHAVAFGPQGMVVTASWDGTAIVWDISDPTRPSRLSTLAGHDGLVHAVAVSPDGRTVATSGEDRTVRLWDVSAPAHPVEQEVLAEHTDGVWTVAFSPDGNTLASASADKTAILWRLTGPPAGSRRLSTLAGHTGSVYGLAFSPDGRRITTAGWDKVAILWDIADAAHPVRLDSLGGHSGPLLTVAFSPDGTQLATGSNDRTVVLWHADRPATPRLSSAVDTPADGGGALALRPDGDVVAITPGKAGNTTALWDIEDRTRPRRVGTLTGHTAEVGPAAFSEDGKLVITGSADNTARLWDVADPARSRPLGVLLGHADNVSGVAVGPDATTAVTGSWDGTAILWDITDPIRPRQLAPLTGHSNWVNGVVISADGRMVATAGGNGTVMLWDITDRDHPEWLSTTTTTGPGAFYGVRFSPDGKTLAGSNDNGTAAVWDISDRRAPQQVTLLVGHASSVFSAEFSPRDSTGLMLTGSWDKTAALWDATELTQPRQLTTLTGQTKAIGSVAFTPDLTTALTLSQDSSLFLWDITGLVAVTADPLGQACATTGRGLTREEWATYAPELPYQSTC